MSKHLRISSQINFRSFRTPPADPGRIYEVLSVRKYSNFCGVRSIRHKSFLPKLHWKSCLLASQLYFNLCWNPSILWDVSMPAIQGSQYGVWPPSASKITSMILGCRLIIFRVASMEEVSHPFSSAFSHIIMVQQNVLKLSIMDNESKFHTKMFVTHMKRHGTQIYLGNGKKPLDRSENGYPPRSHDCMPNETEFVNLQKHSKMNRKT